MTTDVQINPVKQAFKKWGWSLQSSPTQSPQYLMPGTIRVLFNGYGISINDSYLEVYFKQGGPEDLHLGAKPIPNIFAAALLSPLRTYRTTVGCPHFVN